MEKHRLEEADEAGKKHIVMKNVRMGFPASKVKKTSALQAKPENETPPAPAVKTMGLSEILSVEHAVNNLQNAIRTILQTSLDEDELRQFKAQSNESNEVVLALQRSKLTLAAMIKTLHLKGKLRILDQIVKFEQLQGPLISQDITLDMDPLNEVETYDEDEDERGLPPLPQIENPAIRARVFIHKSLVKDKLFISENEVIHTHNERLEFIGDSVMNNIMSQIAYNTFPNATEGQLSQLRAKLISNATIQKWAVEYGFDKELKMNTDSSIYKGKLKIYADVFEAYVGGLITENPGNYTKIYKWLKALAAPLINSDITIETNGIQELNQNAKVELYSLIGYAGLGLTYQTVAREIQNGTSWFKVQLKTKENEILGSGSGKNTKEAGIRAAMAALDNKELIEKYSRLRASIPKTESRVPSREGEQQDTNVQTEAPRSDKHDNGSKTDTAERGVAHDLMRTKSPKSQTIGVLKINSQSSLTSPRNHPSSPPVSASSDLRDISTKSDDLNEVLPHQSVERRSYESYDAYRPPNPSYQRSERPERARSSRGRGSGRDRSFGSNSGPASGYKNGSGYNSRF